MKMKIFYTTIAVLLFILVFALLYKASGIDPKKAGADTDCITSVEPGCIPGKPLRFGSED